MTIGPVEYIIVGFPGNKFTGEIAPELIALVESGTVRILDLIFIGKDTDGSVLSFEIDELDALAGFAGLEARSEASSARPTSSTQPPPSSRTHRQRC